MLSEECKKYISKMKKLAKNPKAKKLSGYNVFSKEKREGLEGTAPEKMKELGAMWKKCSDEKKELWKAKAEKLNKKAAKEFEEDGDELDDQVKELKDLIEETIANFKKNLPKKVKGKKGKKVVKSDKDSNEDEEVPVKTNKQRYNSSSTLVEDFSEDETPVKKFHLKKIVNEESDSEDEALKKFHGKKVKSDDEYSDDDVTLIIKKNKLKN